jgi:hypothetical protein
LAPRSPRAWDCPTKLLCPAATAGCRARKCITEANPDHPRPGRHPGAPLRPPAPPAFMNDPGQQSQKSRSSQRSGGTRAVWVRGPYVASPVPPPAHHLRLRCSS